MCFLLESFGLFGLIILLVDDIKMETDYQWIVFLGYLLAGVKFGVFCCFLLTFYLVLSFSFRHG